MKIIVCVKQVPHPDIIKFNFETSLVEDVFYILSPYDQVALEEAVRIKEKLGNTEVVALTLGPPEAEKILRRCLAMGADKAMLLWDECFKSLDMWATASILAKAISSLSYDIIFCGKMSIDECNSYAGAGIAKSLNLPQVSAVTKLEISSDMKKAIVHRRVENIDREVVECPLPAVFTVDKGLNEPRYVSMARILRAEKKEIIRLDAKSLGIEPSSIEPKMKVLSYSQPKPRLKKGFVIDSNLPPSERLRLIMSGGMKEKGAKLVKKPPEDSASEIIRFLINNNMR